MNNKFEGIKNRLKSWAEVEAKPIPGLSHSSDTIESRLMESGCITSNVAVRTIPSYKPNRQNLEIDQAVSNLDRHQNSMVYDMYVYYPNDFKKCLSLSNRSKASYYAEMDSIYHYIAGSLRYSLK